MKRHVPLRRSRLGAAIIMLSLLLATVGIGGEGLQSTQAQGSTENTPTEPNPFKAPSAVGEMYLLRRAGLLRQFKQTAGVASRVPDARTQQLGTDVLVNNPADDMPEHTTQSETALAMHGTTLCAGYNDSGPGGYHSESGLSRSPDLGATWTDLRGLGELSFGDPVLAVHHATGTFYYAELADIPGGHHAPIGVARSTDDCQSFSDPADASPEASGLDDTRESDKPWLAVDNTGGPRDGNIYVCWTRIFNPEGSELRFSRSINNGASYQDEKVLVPNGTKPTGCSVGVGPSGEVYVAWADREGTTAGDIRLRRSTDGGLHFAEAVTVSTGNRQPGTDAIVTCSGEDRPTLNGYIRIGHNAWMAVDTTGGPFTGTIYVVWARDPVGVPDNSDVFFSRSTDGGAMWSTPVQIGAGGGSTDQFMPFVAVGGNGAISIAWYDRRNDPANDNLIDVFRTISVDGGTTFGSLARITDRSFPVPPLKPNFDPLSQECYMGDYIAVAADANNFYYLWGDNRNTVGGRPDPDIFSDSEPAPVIRYIYLPLLINPDKADLVASLRLNPSKTTFTAGEPVELLVTITNIGKAPSAPVWTDLFINPRVVPTHANILWNDVCDPKLQQARLCFGIAWQVPSLAPNQSITLTSTPDSYAAGYTIWPGWFAEGTRDIYVYVDSWNPGDANGAVSESNEMNNRADLLGLTVTGANPPLIQGADPANLPPRPAPLKH